MAVIASERAKLKPVLVICPSAALVEQLRFQFGAFPGAFWSKIGAPTSWAPEWLEHVLPSTLDELIERIRTAKPGERVVAFSTIQALQMIDAADGYDRIQNLFGTVMFDEGHREPASNWAKVVRGFGASTILFSATPFRNDLKIFNVDLDYVAFLAFSDAARTSLIRDVEIVEQPFAGHAAFVELAIGTREKMIKSGRYSASDKMIVRAAREEDVSTLFDLFRRALRGRPERALALHNTFANETFGAHRMSNDVPDRLANEPYQFMIHQLMLTEGIDDPNCTMLALFDPFSTERQLVQQVGRLTRNPSIGKVVRPAFVLASAGDGVADMWARFLKFDALCKAEGRPPIRNDRKVLTEILDALPQAEYVNGKFRSRFDPDGEMVENDLRMPLSVLAYDVDADFDIKTFDQVIEELLADDDRFVTRKLAFAEGKGRAHVSFRLIQSPFLDQYLFPSPALELTAYTQQGGYLFFYDSAGLWIDEQSGVKGRVAPGRLHCLLPEEDDTTVTSLTAMNTDLGAMAPRSRSLSARSLKLSGLFMGEQHHVISRVTGRFGDRRRALGLTRARVREGNGANASLDDFAGWTEEVAAELKKARAGVDLFRRFAAPIETPDDTDPCHILIDLFDFQGEYLDKDGREASFDLDSVASELERDPDAPAKMPFAFSLVVNNEPQRVYIGWDTERRKYRVRSPDLSAFKLKENPKITLTRRLNQKQPFRIVLANPRQVYAYGRFYDVDLKLNSAAGAGALVMNLVRSVHDLGGVDSEKGAVKGKATTWPKDSVFGVIDASLKKTAKHQPFGSGFADLVCNDLGEEVADFIGVDADEVDGRTSRAVLLVAKYKDGKAGVSASAIYDVCAQAAKNLAYMKPDARDIPGTPTIFDKDWTLKGALIKRRRVGRGDSRDFRAKFARVRSNPRALREIWLVLGGGILSAEALETAFRTRPPKPHVVSFFHLILSLHSACQSVGVNLQIFCAD